MRQGKERNDICKERERERERDITLLYTQQKMYYTYSMSQKSCPILFCNSLLKMDKTSGIKLLYNQQKGFLFHLFLKFPKFVCKMLKMFANLI